VKESVLGPRDFYLLITVFGSMAAGLAYPDLGRPFSPAITPLLMVMLFLSFLQMRFSEVWVSWQKNWPSLFLFSMIKLLVLPAALFFLFRRFWPEYALPVLLLSGISTGIVAPFISDLVGARTPFVLGLVVLTSLLVPLSLPSLVRGLSGREIGIPLGPMVQLLSLIIFVPAALAALLRRVVPRGMAGMERLRYPLSLLLFALINLGVFSRYQAFFRTRPLELANSVLVAFMLSVIFHLAGWLIDWGQGPAQRLAQAVSLAYINNVLVIVFSSQYFGPLCPTLAAMYMLPFFSLIFPLRLLGKSAGR
jgi:BASS family bile acid:Na+ symporter